MAKSRSVSRGRRSARSTSRTRRNTSTPRSRASSARAASSNRSRSMSIATTRSLGGRSIVNRVARENGNSVRTAYVKNQNNKRVSFKKAPKVIVSKKFKMAVNKALMPSAIIGRWRETDMQTIQKIGSSQGGQQLAFEIGPSMGDGIFNAFFSPAEVINAASVLFNDKTNTRSTKLTYTLGLPDFGASSFDPRVAKIEVVSSSARVTFKNNQPRTIIMQVYECSPKNKADLTDYGTPLLQWSQILTNEASISNPSGPINKSATTVNVLYESPLECKALRQNFNIEKHDIIMDPGQSYDHYVQGPTGVYDFQKFWKHDNSGVADDFHNVQPSKTRFLFATFRNDLVNSGTNQYGRLGDATSGGLLIETTRYFTMKAPEITGGTTTVLAANFVNDNRKDTYYSINWAISTVAGDNRIEPLDGRDNLP